MSDHDNDNDNDNDEMGYPIEINYKKITESYDLLPAVRLMAYERLQNPYITPGEWLKNTDDSTISQLLEISEAGAEEDHYGNVMLMTEMLVQAEGLASDSDEEMLKNLNLFVSLLAIEGLSRKGLVKAYHENMSFGEDMGKKIIVEKL